MPNLTIERYVEIRDIPREYVEACSQGGRDAAPFVADALSDLHVTFADPEGVRECLKGYGAWDDDELADDDENAARMFWLICGSFSEYLHEAEEAGFDPYTDERPENFEPCGGSDLFCIER